MDLSGDQEYTHEPRRFGSWGHVSPESRPVIGPQARQVARGLIAPHSDELVKKAVIGNPPVTPVPLVWPWGTAGAAGIIIGTGVVTLLHGLLICGAPGTLASMLLGVVSAGFGVFIVLGTFPSTSLPFIFAIWLVTKVSGGPSPSVCLWFDGQPLSPACLDLFLSTPAPPSLPHCADPA